jgi:Fe-S-cluster containining protein
MTFVLLDNLLTNLPKKYLFKTRWKLEGQCRQCGNCCREIYLKATPRQMASRFFLRLAVAWICWLFDFILLRIESESCYLVFTCRHRLPDGRCGNYFWRPNVCRNYPLVDYFDEPKVLPGCGFGGRERG